MMRRDRGANYPYNANYINVSRQHVHLNFTRCYMSNVFQLENLLTHYFQGFVFYLK